MKEVGPWTKVDLEQPPLEPGYQVVPHVMGILQK